MPVVEKFISKTATNGYSIGSDSNNGNSLGAPYASWAKAIVDMKAAGGQFKVHCNDGTWIGTELGSGGFVTFAANPPSIEIAPENAWDGVKGVRLVPSVVTGTWQYANATVAAGTYFICGPVCFGRDVALGGTDVDPNYHLWPRDDFSNQFEIQLNGTQFINPLFYGINTSSYKMTARGIKFVGSRDIGVRSLISSIISSSAQDWDIDGCTIDQRFVKATGHGGIILDASTSGAKANIRNVDGRIEISPTATGTGNVLYGVVLANIDDAKMKGIRLKLVSDIAGWAPYGAMIRCNDATLTAHRGLIEDFRIEIDSVASGVPVCIGQDSVSEQRTKASNCRIANGEVIGTDRSIESGVHGPAILYQNNGRIEGVESSYVNLGLLLKMTTGSIVAGCLTHHIAVNSGNAGTHRREKGATNCEWHNCTAVAMAGYTAPFSYKDDDTVGPTHSTGGVTRDCNNIQISGTMNNRVNFVAASCTHTFTENNYGLVSIPASGAFSYNGTAYDTLAAWIAAKEAGALSSQVNRVSDFDYSLPDNSPLITGGAKWWTTGPRPMGADGYAFPDFNISKGAYQSRAAPFHPATLLS